MSTIHHPVTTFDDDAEPAEESLHQQVALAPIKRGRGRPKGSLGATTNNDALQSCDFYFFRACLEKIDVGEAAERYLGHRGILDRRTAAAYERALRGRIQRAINLIDDRDKAQAQLNSLMAREAPAFLGPTLDEFACRYDPDMYSERELIELYEEEYGKPQSPPPGGATLKQKRDALNWLLMRLATFPKSDQPVGLWLDQSIANIVKPFGVLTLGNLVDWINLTGRRWFDKLPGVGKHRARRVLVFLLQNEQHFERTLSNRIRFALDDKYTLPGPGDAAERIGNEPGRQLTNRPSGVVDVQCFGIVPMDSLSWPIELLGTDGMFRRAGPNTYGATDDRHAIQEWFKTLEEKSPATQDSYRRAVERLVLWAIVERRCPISSLTTVDFTAFRDFLRAPPPHWCSRFPAMRYSEDWRPMRGPLDDVSVQATMSAVSTLFSDLLASGYLSANAVASVRTAKRRTMRMDVMRSFAEDDLAVIRNTLEAMADGPSKRRLLAILLLLQTTGMRRSEVISLKWGMLAPIRLNNRISEVWAATFVGKGNKERVVPLQAGTIMALQAHFDDRQALVEAGKLPYLDLEKDSSPVLSILDDRLTHRRAGAGDLPSDAPRTGNPTGALSASSIYKILKRFFIEAAKNVEQSDRVHGQADFLKASTHWLRHTFAHQALQASDRDLPAVQQILGHANIGTTGLYTKADMASRVAAVSGVVGFDKL